MDDTDSMRLRLPLRMLACRAAVIALALGTTAAVAQAAHVEKDITRYVIDQDNELPVAGAIVVATWRSVSRSGYQICNRIESYISDANGSFKTPTDSDLGVITMEAYKNGYAAGISPRGIQMASDGDYRHAQIVHYKWNEANNRAEVIRIEPRIYKDRASAIDASRERIDAFVRKSPKDGRGRLAELHQLRAHAICEGGSISTPGPAPFLDAILREQSELNDERAQIDFTVKIRDTATTTPSR
jgi:hypothetical protein